MKEDLTARSHLRSWLEQQNMMQLPVDVMQSDHLLAAAALATWRWKDGRSNWLHPAWNSNPGAHQGSWAT